ncbi:MAG: hypothetical protein PF636_11425 [Actinomycetota bacterium]|jgi:hypothetical protein|nr:hypothetical protein [Actinomycetota bacterium]
MAICKYMNDCQFFGPEVGYSPEMYEHLRQGFCLGDSHECARLKAVRMIGPECIPDDLLPTETERLHEITIKMGLHH